MTYNEICMTLANAEIENNRGETAMLICHFCNVTKADLLLRRDEDFDSPELAEAVMKRCQHYPLQYILGYCSFCNETYKVTENTLIPRQDTEKLVELAIRLIPENARIIDLCTGSGCVAISTLSARTDCHALALDIFPETLALACENAEKNGVSDRFTAALADVLSEPNEEIKNIAPFDAVLSNPPYIQTEVVKTLSPEVRCEPEAALDGGDDGLDFYRAILNFYTPLLTPNGFFAFEIGYDQGEEIFALANECGFTCEIIKDLSGCNRVAFLKKSI